MVIDTAGSTMRDSRVGQALRPYQQTGIPLNTLPVACAQRGIASSNDGYVHSVHVHT